MGHTVRLSGTEKAGAAVAACDAYIQPLYSPGAASRGTSTEIQTARVRLGCSGSGYGATRVTSLQASLRTLPSRSPCL